MIHIFEKGTSDYTFIMLHGTGGNEHEMLNFSKRINEDVNVLSIRGNIVENGMNRYFKRKGIGNYDIENYISETKILINNIKNLSEKYNFDLNKTFVIGFSNGANIALGILQEDAILNNYILLSPDFINKDRKFKNIENKNIFISTADDDPYVNVNNMNKLINELKDNKTNLEVFKSHGHQINIEVLNNAIKFINNIKNTN